MGKAGFTLLEIMLATTILAMVSSMVGFALSSTVSVMEATGDQKAIYRQARVVLERIAEDLSGALADEHAVFEGNRQEINGMRADTVTFHSLAHLSFSDDDDLPGAAVIGYTVLDDEDNPGSLKLLRSDILRPFNSENAEPPEYALGENLRSFTLKYQTGEGQESDTWEQDDDQEEDAEPISLPAVVFISIEFWLDKDAETYLPFETAVWLPTGVISMDEEDEE